MLEDKTVVGFQHRQWIFNDRAHRLVPARAADSAARDESVKIALAVFGKPANLDAGQVIAAGTFPHRQRALGDTEVSCRLLAAQKVAVALKP